MTVAAYNAFDSFTSDLVRGEVNFSEDAFKAALTNVAPSVSDHYFSEIAEIASGNGYPAGGLAVPMSLSSSAGAETVTAGAVTFSAIGGSIGPFRYVVLYDWTAPMKNLVCWFDNDVSIALGDGNTFPFQPNSGDVEGTLFQLVLAE